MFHRFPSINALDCFSCQNVGRPALCNTSVTCGLNQYCFLDDLGGSYSMGCLDSRNCRADAASLVGRHAGNIWTKSVSPVSPLNRRQTSQCHECCSSDGCNKDLCQHLKPSQCRDDESLDCAKLSTVINICQDIQKAKITCPRFCDLCSLVDGQWAQWTSWSSCDVTCNTGTEVRTRTCTNPAPAYGGLDCIGNDTENKVCRKEQCPVHGGWSDWSSWGSCSATCDIGLERRDRSCSNPWPSLAGDHCFGDAHEDRICFSTPCADGGWSNWSSWGTCTKTCDTGTRSRSRTCTNPRPSIMGRYCDGVPAEVDICKEHACSDGGWSSWGSWGSCSGTCGGGVRLRSRSCTNPSPSLIGRQCTGDSSDVSFCNRQLCPDYNVAFTAYNLNTSGTSYAGFRFRNVYLNNGNAYNTTTGKFTCKIPGVYYFAVTLTKLYKDISNLYAYLRINGSSKLLMYFDPDDDNSNERVALPLTTSGTFHLNTNDTVYVYGIPSNFYEGFSSFTGILVIQDQ